jgi:hypothetical protein
MRKGGLFPFYAQTNTVAMAIKDEIERLNLADLVSLLYHVGEARRLRLFEVGGKLDEQDVVNLDEMLLTELQRRLGKRR